MEIMLAGIRIIGTGGTKDSVVNHNHSGRFRDQGECPACDQFYALYSGEEQTA